MSLLLNLLNSPPDRRAGASTNVIAVQRPAEFAVRLAELPERPAPK